ncbi:MAG: sigma-70 family RNA polymerase sigma factor [Candidatus Krumholzibacteriia bacterium]
MDRENWLTHGFEESRTHLNAVAFRMLGSAHEAEDAVQEAWIRLSRSDAGAIDNVRGWLTTVVARICLDMLRARKAKREEALDLNDLSGIEDSGAMPDDGLYLAETVGPALLGVLNLLSPAERIAFVLHDLFDIPFHDIAPIIDRNEMATRQLASRARRRVRGSELPGEDAERQQTVVAAFMAASREGNFDALIRLLHPDVVLRADETAIRITTANMGKGAPQFAHRLTGAGAVAETFKGKALGAELAVIDGLMGMTWAPPGGKPVFAWCFTLDGERITAIDVVMDQTTLREMDIRPAGGSEG